MSGTGPSAGTAGPGVDGVEVLVVDDHDVVHWGFKLLLSNQPWVANCTSVSSSAAALTLSLIHI